MTKMAKPFLNTATIECMEAAHGKRVVLAASGNCFKHMGRHIGRYIKFPAQLTNITDTVCPRDGMANLDRLHCPKGKILIFQALRN